MKQTSVGKLVWERTGNFAGDYSWNLYLQVDNEHRIRAQNILEKYADKMVKITIEVLEDEDEDVAV